MKILLAIDDRQPRDRYRNALLVAGALPEEVHVILPGEPIPTAFDGLLLSGGADVEPSRYGEDARVPSLELYPARDALDFALVAKAAEKSVPVFGICRGLQVLNVVSGGTLYQDLPLERPSSVQHEFDRREGWPPGYLAHTVAPVDATTELGRFFHASGEQLVNSRHHQGVKALGAGLVPLAAAPDGLVEAFERPGDTFWAAVQWHPEDLLARPFQKALVQRFLSACREHARGSGRAVDPPVEVLLEGRIPVVRLNRPARRNAFAGGMREVLAGTIDALGGDTTVPALVLTGAGSSFSTGFDREVLRAYADLEDVAGFEEALREGARATLSIATCPHPVLAAIDGPAVGSGASLALACDVRVASAAEGHEASFAFPFTQLGLPPAAGASFLLPALVGAGQAADLLLSGESLPAHRAEELGLVDVLVEDGPALPHALRRAALYAERSSPALVATRKALFRGREAALSAALEDEILAAVDLFRSGETARRLTFRTKRKESPEPS
ncbi:MAG: gamma-glutamyl-gamma-aminobutyrate hydrolase family protein [Acidobacteria bacterium]|nr:gamma-glutamyl-gamma-aminobutyrate hydrolase family protein [Acidobacteriota bacterium]